MEWLFNLLTGGRMKTIIALLIDLRSLMLEQLTVSKETRDLVKQLVEGDKEVVGLKVSEGQPVERP